MDSVKLAKVIEQFDGSGNFSEWLKKFELVASLQELTDLHAYLPLFLSGKAFAIYDGLKQVEKKDYSIVKAALTRAFSFDEFSAYEAFVSRRYVPGEPVDFYVSDLRRLGELIDSAVPENFIKCSFIAGLPTGVKAQLKSATSLLTMSLAEVVERARIVLSMDEGSSSAYVSSSNSLRNDSRGKCYRCNSAGHISRNCPDRFKNMVCFVCDKRGHIASTCPEKQHAPKNE